MTTAGRSQTCVMDKLTKKLKEQIAVEEFINADQVFARDPLEFIDQDGNKVDDRIDGAQGSTACGDEVDEI